jgi:hypothetical protein
MTHLVFPSARTLAAFLLTVSFAVAACSGGAGPTTAPGGSSIPTATESAAGGGASSPGTTSVQGSLVSSGPYAATWTWQPGNAADVGIGGVTLNSDKGTFGSVSVLSDGSITFTSGAPELSAGSPYTGTGAQVHLKNVQGADLPCAFTLDNDLTGTNGTVVHLKGDLTIIGTPFDC